MKITKYQQGGIGPNYQVYTPLVGATPQAPTAPSQQVTEDKSLIDKDTLIKLGEEALPSDLQAFLNNANLFGESIWDSGFTVGSSNSRMKTLLLSMNRMRHEKEMFHKAIDNIRTIEGASEIAVTPNNGVYVIRDGSLKEVTVSSVKKGEVPLTNAQLAELRANSVGAAFNSTMTQTLDNATSMKQIRAVIEDALSSLGHTKNSIQDFEALESLGDISLADLQQLGYNQLVKEKAITSSNREHVYKAVRAIYGQLNNAQRVMLEWRKKQLGVKDVESLILEFVASRIKDETSIGIDLNGTGRGSRGGGNGESPMNDLPYNEALQLITGRGFNQLINFHEGTQAQITTRGTHSLITSKSGESVGQKAATYILDSSLAAALDFNNISIGGATIDQEGLNRIMIRDATAVGVDLPYTVTEEGTIIPNINLTKKVQEIEQYIVENNITDIAQINQLYAESDLPVKFLGVDSTGDPILNTTSYRRFVGINVLADRKAFDENLIIDLNRSLVRVSNKARLKDFQNVMRETSYDDAFKYTDPWWGGPEVYEGILWTPLKTNALQAYLGAEENITVSEAEAIERAEQEKQTIASAPLRYRTINQADYGI